MKLIKQKTLAKIIEGIIFVCLIPTLGVGFIVGAIAAAVCIAVLISSLFILRAPFKKEFWIAVGLTAASIYFINLNV
jgi:hypothetical protein